MEHSGADALRIVERCFEAIARRDADALVAHYTEDYVLELPYFKPDEPLVVEGRDAVHAYLGELLEGQEIVATITGHHWIADEALLIAEYTSRGRFLDNEDPYWNRYVGYWYFRGDRVRRLREYYNPQAPRASAIDGSG